MINATFAATLSAAALPPALLPPQVLCYAHYKQWNLAHDVAQANATDAVYCWPHAYLPRREGTSGNATYRYRRARRTAFSGPLTQEWEALALAATEN